MKPPTSADESVMGGPTDRDLLSCLLDSIPDRIYFKDEQGRFLRVSHAQARFLGAESPEEVTGKSDFDYFAPELAQAAFDDEKRVMESGVAITGKVEEKQLLDGRTGWALVAKIPLRDASGRLIGTCGISKDITELKDAEQRLREANTRLAAQKKEIEAALAKLDAAHEDLKSAQQRLIELENVRWIARLAYGVAHEIRNPLGTLEMGVSFLRKKALMAQDAGASAMVEAMSEAVSRADVVVTALIDGAVASGVTIKPADIAGTVEDAVGIMRSRAGGESSVIGR